MAEIVPTIETRSRRRDSAPEKPRPTTPRPFERPDWWGSGSSFEVTFGGVADNLAILML